MKRHLWIALALAVGACDSPTAPEPDPVVEVPDDPEPVVGSWLHLDTGTSAGEPITLEWPGFAFVVLYASPPEIDWHLSPGIRIVAPGVVEVDLPAGWLYAVFYYR